MKNNIEYCNNSGVLNNQSFFMNTLILCINTQNILVNTCSESISKKRLCIYKKFFCINKCIPSIHTTALCMNKCRSLVHAIVLCIYKCSPLVHTLFICIYKCSPLAHTYRAFSNKKENNGMVKSTKASFQFSYLWDSGVLPVKKTTPFISYKSISENSRRKIRHIYKQVNI